MSAKSETVPDARTARTSDRDLLVRVDDLHLTFETKRGDIKALDGVSFDIHDGEFMALVGETGCGKTVTGRSFTQLVPSPPGRYPHGRVLMRSHEQCPECAGAGCDVCYGTGREFENLLELPRNRIKEYRGRRISMIFQDPETALNPSLTIRNQMAEAILAHQSAEVLAEAGISPEHVNLLIKPFIENELAIRRSTPLSLLASIPPLREYKRSIRAVIDDRIVGILSDVQIPNPRDVLTNYPHELSGGQQQRVVIGMALVARPELIIADEATTALDVTTQARILRLVNDLQREEDTSLLYITHDLDLVREIADRVAVMYAGSISEVGDVERVYTNPYHPYTRGLINSIPRPEMRGKKLEGIEGSVPDMINPPDGCRFCTRCPEVMDHCCDEDPPVVEEEPGHIVNCHLYPSEGGDRAQPGETAGSQS